MMRGIGSLSAGLMLLVLISACADKSTSASTVRVETEDIAIAEELRHELDSREIWYGVLDETSIEVRPDSAELVILILNEIGDPLLPAERHASFPDTIREKIIAELERNNIPFEVVEAFNDKWIVWEHADTARVREIIDSVTLPSD